MFPQDRRHGEDLVLACNLRVLHKIDDLDMVASGEVLFADSLEIAERGDGFRGRSRDIQPQIPNGWRRSRVSSFRERGCFHDFLPLRPFPPLLVVGRRSVSGASFFRLRPISTSSKTSDCLRSLS